MVEIIQRNSDGVLVKGDVKPGDARWSTAGRAATRPTAPAVRLLDGAGDAARQAQRRPPRLHRSPARQRRRAAPSLAAAAMASQNELQAAARGLFVRRPVLAVVINALIVVGGLAAFLGVEVRELPTVEQPVLTVTTSFTGAAAETVDREITSAVEGAVARVQGVTGISSSSSYGRSRVTLTFADGTNLDTATSDVRDATSRAQQPLSRRRRGAGDRQGRRQRLGHHAARRSPPTR